MPGPFPDRPHEKGKSPGNEVAEAEKTCFDKQAITLLAENASRQPETRVNSKKFNKASR